MRDIILHETTTLGVRSRREERAGAAARRHETVTTPWGEVRMKIASLNGSDHELRARVRRLPAHRERDSTSR